MRTRAHLLWDLGLEEEEEAMDLEVCVCVDLGRTIDGDRRLRCY
jgi:hypothetical protein